MHESYVFDLNYSKKLLQSETSAGRDLLSSLEEACIQAGKKVSRHETMDDCDECNYIFTIGKKSH